VCNGQEYTVLAYDCGSETNPYERGVSAFGVYRSFVVVAELTCTEDYTGDEQALLAEFLNGCHYSAELLKQRKTPPVGAASAAVLRPAKKLL